MGRLEHPLQPLMLAVDSTMLLVDVIIHKQFNIRELRMPRLWRMRGKQAYSALGL